MSVYKRGQNWYIDFTFKGQRVRESIGPSRKDAAKVMAKRKTEIVENKYLDIRQDPEPVKFYDFSKEYLEWVKVNRKPSAHLRVLSLLRQLNQDFETRTLQEITPWQIEKHKAKRKEHVKPASVNRELALLKHMFTKAIEWGKVKENPAKKVKLFRGEVKRVRYLMADEIQRLLSNCSNYLKPIVTVAVHTGMRKGELLDLKWDWVNLEQGIITLIDTKNGERKDIPMNATVKALLSEMERTGPFVFGGLKKRDNAHVYRSFREAVEKSGIEDFRYHDLRHCFASHLVMQGIDLNTVRELMGHKGIAMTLRYSHLAPGHKSKAVNMLDRVLSQNPPQEEKVISLMR
jgi:integrase